MESRQLSARFDRIPTPTGGRIYNSAAVISNGELVRFVDKSLLPEYDVFDDPRYFEPNENPNGIVEITTNDGKSHKLGVVVCEDFWNDKTFWKERLYDNDPTDIVVQQRRGNYHFDQRFAV